MCFHICPVNPAGVTGPTHRSGRSAETTSLARQAGAPYAVRSPRQTISATTTPARLAAAPYVATSPTQTTSTTTTPARPAAAPHVATIPRQATSTLSNNPEVPPTIHPDLEGAARLAGLVPALGSDDDSNTSSNDVEDNNGKHGVSNIKGPEPENLPDLDPPPQAGGMTVAQLALDLGLPATQLDRVQRIASVSWL